MKTINPHVKLLSGEHGTSPICSLCRSNSSFDAQNYPTYIFRYVTTSKGNKYTIEKVFSCGDSGVQQVPANKKQTYKKLQPAIRRENYSLIRNSSA